MAYARQDMDGLACTEDVLRVIPDKESVPSGYLYAYLSSKFGVPLVVSGTYGASIQHIEPAHIASLPVPRLGDAVEQRVHELVEKAANCAHQGSLLYQKASEEVYARTLVPDFTRYTWHKEQQLSFTTSFSDMRIGKIKRLRAGWCFHSMLFQRRPRRDTPREA